MKETPAQKFARIEAERRARQGWRDAAKPWPEVDARVGGRDDPAAGLPNTKFWRRPKQGREVMSEKD